MVAAARTRAFCYVDDLIDGLVRLMMSKDDVAGPVNIGDPEEFTILEPASVAIDLVASRSCIVHRPRPQDDPRQRHPDISRAQEVLERKPRTMVKEGRRTITHFENLPIDQAVRAMLVEQGRAARLRYKD